MSMSATTNLSNWRDPGHSQWGFQNVDKLIATDVIHKGEKASKLESKPRDFTDFKITTPKSEEFDLPGFLNATETDGIVVLHNGDLVFEHYDHENTKDSKHIMMSMTKSVTGLIAGILVDQGKLDVDAPVSKYVPEVKGCTYENVTVRQCLDMRSGIKYDDSTPAYRKAAGWNPLQNGEKQTNLHEFIANFNVPQTAVVEGLEGWGFEYVSVNTDLMGWILERASGNRFADLVSELIWKPMGAENDAWVTIDSAKNARTAGGMCASCRDIARLGNVLVKDDNGIVPKSWIHDIVHNGSREAFAAGSWKRGFEAAFNTVAYRSYCVADSDSETIIGIGIHGQMMFVDRKNGVVMAKTSSQPDRINPKKSALTISAFKEFQRILAG